MALRMATQIHGNVVVLRCHGRIVFGDEGAVFRERVRSELTGTSKIVIDLCSVDYIDSGGLGIIVGLHIAAKNRGGEGRLLNWMRNTWKRFPKKWGSSAFYIV